LSLKTPALYRFVIIKDDEVLGEMAEEICKQVVS